ncbi:COP23 domain-containing protein [Phormidium sp. CCY1219]|uniref:COP23 domain-containing protein n=1 Tax=Phormidium sp. CCY1219 TaxID=2886104 RepID=UPI002D1EFE49|nr:COP23 domain-containing protein [Phormidium sp. CCY1219]MEB3830008.1 COP23 domain-containing protein [Phormidium sp. CCY1219]
MKFKSIATALLGAVAACSTMAFKAEAQSVSFACENIGGEWRTYADVNGQMANSPMIRWTTTLGGGQWDPARRCQTVTRKLNWEVRRNGGTMDGLFWNVGLVNNSLAVCFGNVRTGRRSCNSRNMLFTLKPENARDAGTVLTKLYGAIEGWSTGAITESNSDAGAVNASDTLGF